MSKEAKALDKFYTKPEIAKSLTERAKALFPFVQEIIEPSAGNGIFFQFLKENFKGAKHTYLDIAPEHPEIIRQDWLEWNKGSILENALIVGNPPFGKNSSLAVRFFNKAAEHHPKAIAFVLPKTFMKQRWWKKLSTSYSLLWQEECPKNSFTFNGREYDVPCVMQIWERRNRINSLPEKCVLFKETSPNSFASNVNPIFIRRAGGKAGQIVEDYTPSSTYCVEYDSSLVLALEMYKDEIVEQACKTAGVRSISLLEIEDIILNRYVPF